MILHYQVYTQYDNNEYEMYIQHMIPHHQVAIDMSKIILKTTNNDFINLAYNIISSQQLEIFELYNLSKSKYIFESNMLT